MSIRYAFDLYPRTAPLTGDRLVRFTNLQTAEWRGEANGTGAGRFSIRASDSEAAFIDPEGMQYVRVVRIDTSDDSEAVVGGFFLEQGDYVALSENSTKLLTFGGAGLLSYLSHAVMWSESYLTTPFIGTDPYDDLWRLYEAGTGNTIGAILWRVITEATAADRDQQPLNGVTMTFNYVTDSNGATWSQSSGNFQARIKENVLDVVRRLMEIGLYVEIDYDTFELSAYEPGTHRRDRTGSSWGTSVIRFQSPTDGTIATGNIKADAKRNLIARQRRSHLLVGAFDNYVAVGDVDVDVHWEGAYDFEAEVGDPQSAMLDAGHAQLDAQGEASDTLRLRMKLGDDPSNGIYKPFESDGVMLDDLVTVHTGTGQWDWNEAEFPVSALTIQLRPGGDWDCWVDLGSVYQFPQSRAFQTGGTGVPAPPLRLCSPTVAGGDFPEVVDSWELGTGNPASISGMTVPDDPTQALILFVVTWNAGDIGTPTYDSDATNVLNTPASFTKHATDFSFPTAISPNQHIQIWILDAPEASSGANGFVGFTPNGTAFASALVLVKNTASGSTIRLVDTASADDGSGSISNNIASTAGELVLSFVGFIGEDATETAPTAGGSQTVLEASGAWRGPGDGGGGFGLSSQVGASQTNSWTVMNADSGDNQGLGQVDVVVAGGTPTENPLAGNSPYAARCDHKHHVLSASEPTVDDDTDAGYPVGTMWIQVDDVEAPTSITGRWLLIDNSAGAAVWESVAGGGGSGAPTDVDYLVGTASGDLSAEIVVGTTPGGELGGTWASPTVDATHSGSAHSDFIAKSLADAKGDLIVASAADTVGRLPVGTNGQRLVADSGETLGVKWADAASGGAEELDDLTDVDTTSDAPADGDVLTYDSGSSLWVPAAPTGGGGGGSDIDADGVLALTTGTPPTAGVAGKVLLYADYLPNTTPQIPTMTSNTSPSGTVNASSAYSAYPAWQAFNPSAGSGWLTNGTTTGWLSYQFGSAKTIGLYSMRAWYQPGETARAIKSWTFEGSNDGSSWTTLDTQTNYTWSDYASMWDFTVASPGSYTYYRVNISANQGDASYVGIGKLQMYLAGTIVGLFAMASDGSVWHQ